MHPCRCAVCLCGCCRGLSLSCFISKYISSIVTETRSSFVCFPTKSKPFQSEIYFPKQGHVFLSHGSCGRRSIRHRQNYGDILGRSSSWISWCRYLKPIILTCYFTVYLGTWALPGGSPFHFCTLE